MSLLRKKNYHLYRSTRQTVEIMTTAEEREYPKHMMRMASAVDDDLFQHINQLFQEDYQTLYDFISKLTDIIGEQKEYREEDKHMPNEMRIRVSKELSKYLRRENLIEEDEKLLNLTNELIREIDHDEHNYSIGSNEYNLIEAMKQWAIKLEPRLETILECCREIDRIVQENPGEFGMNKQEGNLRM